ncbi:MAG: low molecular weight phosphotyrosine protein phosphatase [Phycisphaerales bacterium]|nr:low molecular weight phosphotyrosine protein phosphatase [Phycisphaerales bacterium]
MTTEPKRVLFVCLGNICRSPLAEAIFLHLIEQRGIADRFIVDSCGTGGWHAGNRADPRSIMVGAKNGITVDSIARKFDQSTDPDGFDLFLAMDAANKNDLIDLGVDPAKIRLMRSFDPSTPNAPDVPDPYYGGDNGFDKVYEMLLSSCTGLLDSL